MTATRRSSNGTARLIIGIISAAFMAAGIAATLMGGFFYSKSDASAHVATYKQKMEQQAVLDKEQDEKIKALDQRSQATHNGVIQLLERVPAKK